MWSEKLHVGVPLTVKYLKVKPMKEDKTEGIKGAVKLTSRLLVKNALNMPERPFVDPNSPWLDTRLTKEAMDHLWNNINGKQTDARKSLVGNISKSEYIEDKDNWFYENVLKELTEHIFYKDWNNYYNVHVTKVIPPTVFELKELWVNYQKQHEFNPPHTHQGGHGFSFVVFMKIPTHWKEQHALPWLKDVKHPAASDFHFLLEHGMGRIQNINIPLCPEDEGRILFFPAWLFHQVFPFYECEEERITISGNIFEKINENF